MSLRNFSMLTSFFALLVVLVSLQVTAQIRPPTWPDVPLPSGPIRDVILDNCVSCHGIDDYAFYALDLDGWEELLETKHQGDFSYDLARSEEIMLQDYLVANFGPDSIPFPRNYVPPEITEFFTDADARIFMEVRCISCHTLDPVFNTRNSPEGWRVLLVSERERGARLNDEELERLAEWLGRARGINLFE